MSEQFTKLQEVHRKDSALNKVIGNGSEWLAHFAAYGVAILAIAVLSAIFAQNLSGVFTDPTMHAVGVGAAIAVGMSSVIFLLWRDKLLKSHAQFIAACVFVTLELALLSLGALFAFGRAFGWTFAPIMEWVERIAIVVTLPVVGVEWIVVKALSPGSIAARAMAHTDAEVSKSENLARKHAKLSDAVLTVRQQGVLAQVIGEELARLPASQRPYFLRLIMKHHSDDLKDIQDVLRDLADDQTPGEPVKSPNGRKPEVVTLNSEGEPVTPAQPKSRKR